jgi:hypothetical protein
VTGMGYCQMGQSVLPHLLPPANTQLSFTYTVLIQQNRSVSLFKQKLKNGFVEAALKFFGVFLFLTSIWCLTTV